MRDPKTIITPDAFSVAPSLLGIPLATPWRRFWALWIDVLLVGLITVLTSGFWFILGVVIAAFLVVRAAKRGEEGGPSTTLRLFLGCAGVTVLTLTVSTFLAVQWFERQADPEQVLLEFVEGLNPEAVIGGDPERFTADPGLELTEAEFAALQTYRDSIAALEDELRDTRAERDQALTSPSFSGWITGKLDNIGFGLGWWTMYFAILMPLMKGQTPGKKALGIRVLRLDGHPVTWWHAFERAGGYAAGFATGLLGFLQIYWDPNRQATHDKIAGTVVVRDGAPKVEGTWDR